MAQRQRALDLPAFVAWCVLAALVCYLWSTGAVTVATPALMMVVGLILGDDLSVREE